MVDDKPFSCPCHRLSRVEWDIFDKKVAELAKYELIGQATGSYAATNVLPVKMDADDNYTDRRMCGDYPIPNLKTKRDRYPMPTLEDIFDSIEGCSILFPVWICSKASNKLRCLKNTRRRPPFGHPTVDDALAKHSNAKFYKDDVLIYRKTFKEH